MSDTEAVGRLMSEMQAGRTAAFEELFTLVYGELIELARGQRKRFSGYETMNTTALVHEVYLKLGSQANASWTSKAHFLAVAARAIRQILLNYARDQMAQKRGGEWRRTTFDAAAIGTDERPAAERAETLIALDAALARLALDSERLSRIVECRFFGGMSIEQTAAALDVSTATVTRGWATAQAWLHRELEPEPGGSVT